MPPGDPHDEALTDPLPPVTEGRREAFELDAELRRAEDDFARGDYVDVGVEQLERCVATGESPWPGASRD